MKVNVWVIDDKLENYKLVISSFPGDANDYCSFCHFDKGLEAVNLINKAIINKDYSMLPDIVFLDYYIEGDGWTGDKIAKLVTELYKKYSLKKIVPFIIAFSSIDKRNEDIMSEGASESVLKDEYNGICDDIINIFYNKEVVMSYIKPRYFI